MSLIDDLANEVLDELLGTPGLLPSTVYIGLLLQAPDSNGSGVQEPTGNGYVRVGVDNNDTEWPDAINREKVHANDIVFDPADGGSWGTIVWGGVFDASTGGNLLIAGALTTPRTVNDTDVFRFLASNPLKLTLPFS